MPNHRRPARYLTSKRAHTETMEMLAHLHDIAHETQQAQEAQAALLRRTFRKVGKLMTTLAELNQMIDENSAKVQANTDALSAIKDLIDGLKAQITKIQADLDAAIAANDPAAIQLAADNLRAMNEKLDAQKAAEDALLNTSPPPPPPPVV